MKLAPYFDFYKLLADFKINNIIDKDLKDYESISEKVRRFRETLEFSMKEKKELISHTLLRIFPGRFGEIIVSSYKPFLSLSIDSDEKKGTWLKFVEYLDDIDEVDENHIFMKNMNNAIKSNIEDFEEGRTTYIRSLLDGDSTTIEQFKTGMIQFIKTIQENDEMRKKYKEDMASAKDMMENIRAVDNSFDTYLEILSDDYRRYREIVAKLREEVDQEIKKEYGRGMDELLKEL